MSSGKAPVRDVSFAKRKTGGATGTGKTVDDDSSTASGNRRFFPSSLFSGGDQKESTTTPPRPKPSPVVTSLTPFTPERKRQGDAIVVRSLKMWDVKMPPVKKHMVSGRLVPTMRGAARFIQRNRRVTIEVHGPPVYANDTQSVLSAMTPMGMGRMQTLLTGGSPQTDLALQDRDVVRVRILKASSEHDDAHSPSHHGENDEDLSTLGPYAPDDTDGSFAEHYAYRLEDVELLTVHGRTCEVKVGQGSETIVRDLKFEAEKEALAFEVCLSEMKRLVQDRAKRRAEEYRKQKKTKGSSPRSPPRSHNMRSRDLFSADDSLAALEEGDVDIKILIDIVSGIDLPVADLLSADPYVVVKLGSKELHRTKVQPKTLNPIWTVESRSLCLLHVTTEEFFASTSGLTFLVKDYDAVGRNETLGKVIISHDELLNGTGERKEYPVLQDKQGKQKTKPRLVLRFKEASDDDVEFMSVLQSRLGDIGIHADETFLPPRPPDSKLLKRMTKKSGQTELHRVKPFPDPNDQERTKWMSKDEIRKEALKESQAWIEAGSGDLGRLYVEVIGCDDLPNMDAATLNLRDKTDAFVCLVFEDSVVNTDVIGDTLKPRWVPWSHRAFVFNISHAQSDLYLGVFDYDPPNSLGQVATRSVSSVHDPIGRVAINLGRYLPRSMYELKFPLYYDEEGAAKKNSSGSISLRLRLEWNKPATMMMKAAIPPEPMYVSCAKRLDWEVAHYTVSGPASDGAFSIAKLTEYIGELQENEKLVPQVVDAALNLFLWRGGQEFKVCGMTFAIPFHSIIAFCWGLLVSWDFNFLPAFLIFSVGWFFLAMNQQARQNPSPWHKPVGYGAISSRILLMKKPITAVEPNEGAAEFQAYMAQKEAEQKNYEEEKKMMELQDEQFREQLQSEIDTAESDETAIQTKRKTFGGNLNPLKPILYPAQLQLEMVVKIQRVIKSISVWDEPYLAWWITTASLVACLLTLCIPWGFLIRWGTRICVFVFLGPWFAIYDRCFVRRKDQSAEEQNAAMKKRMKLRYQQVREAASTSRTRKERAVKLQSMKKYLYGKFLINVPTFYVEKYASIPLPESCARPFAATKQELVIVDKKYGQKLTGDMIPAREFQLATGGTQRRKRRNGKLSLPWFGRKKNSETEPLLTTTSKPAPQGRKYDSVDAKRGAF